MLSLTLYLSSPDDVRDERQAAGRIVERLQSRYWRSTRLTLVTAGDEAAGPGECDAFIAILWSKLSPPQPTLGGKPGLPGTERELETAALAGGEGKAPELLIFRRVGEREVAEADRKVAKAQLRALEGFWKRFSQNRDGTVKHGPASYESVDDFAAKLEQWLEAFVLQRLRNTRSVPEEALQPGPVKGPPFRGAEAYRFEDAGLFFGRERAIAEALGQLKRNHADGQAFLLIYGAAGSGKTSLIQAGLTPRLMAEGSVAGAGAWRRAELAVSGGTSAVPVLADGLMAALPELGRMKEAWDAARLTEMLGRPESLALTQATIVAALDRVSAARPAQLLITLDDLEPVLDAPDGAAFFKAIAALAVSRRIWVIGALGSEAFPRVAEQRELFRLVRREGGFFLGTPDPDELRQIVRCPALSADLQFEVHAKIGKELSERILDDAGKAADVLPALEFALQELYLQRRGNVLTWTAYEKLGGLAKPARIPTVNAVAQVKPGGSGKLRFFQTTTALLVLAGAGTAVMMRQRPQPATGIAMAPKGSALAVEIRQPAAAAADFDAAATRIANGSPDEALPFLASSLQSDSRNLEAQALLLSTLRQTGWHVPVLHLKLPQTVHQLAFGPETDTLFAAADGEGKPDSFQALMRWDLDTATLSAVLSPVWDSQQTGALSISPDGRHLIVRRGDASQTTTLLCDSLTMAVESKLTPAKSMDGFCWSPDGLLFGYAADDDKGGILWRICDTASGAVIREADSFPNPGWSAVTLGRTNLRAVAKDGTVVEVPLNPKFPTRSGRLDVAPVAVAFSPEGSEILAEFAGAGAARRGVYSIADSPEGGALDVKPVPDGAAHEWTTGSTLLEQFPWARGKASMAPVAVHGRRLDLTGGSDFFHASAAPFRESGEIEAVASIGKKIAISSGGGEVTLHEWLPPLAGETPKPDPAKGQAEWIPMGSSASGILEKNGTAWRLNRGKDAVVALAPEIRAAAANPKGDRIVAGGSAGLWSVDAGSGEVLSSTLPVEDVREIVFLADGKRIAVAGATEVVVLELLEDGFERLASLPVTGATGLKELAEGKLLAVANSTEIGLFETQRFSRTGTLHAGPGAVSGDLAWAEDKEHGWLACARGPRLDVWSLRSGRPLAMSLPLAATPRRMEFQAQDQWGVLCDGGFFVPLARVSGLTSGELAALQSLAEAVSGTRLDEVSRTIDFLSSEERKAAAAKADVTVLIRLLPGSAPVREKFATLEEREAQPEALVPLWNGLAFSPGADGLKIARWAEELGKDQPWYRAFVRGLIAESDRELYEGKNTAPAEGIADLRRMAGEDEAARKLMKAAWLSRDLVPAHRERREAALPVLNDRIAVTAASYEASRTSANAIAHAEALALRNDPEAPAAAFLTGKVGAEEDLTLEQAHFLIASGLAATCTPAIDRSLKALQSPWLWIAWLELQAGQDRANLPGRIQQVMMEAGGRGPVAAKALGAAFKAESPEAIAMALAQSKGMPPQLVEYATGRALWLQGKKAEVFAMWPQGPPDLQKLAEAGGWNGWEQAVGWEQAARFSAEVAEELGTLKVQPGDTIETQRALAAKLMDPKTAAAFGGKRVRDAMVDLALVLASDKGSNAVVMKMIERARLTGADPVVCLRAEARNLYAMGQPTSAYSRWIQILDAPESGLIGTDCIEAAQCLVQDQQDAAAVELLMRGPNLFPHDAVFAYQAAWMLLGMNHPEQANLVLDYGFRIPFAQDQIQMATAMQVCAAELTQRSDQANQAFRELVQFDPSWGNAANLKQLDWPQQLKQAIIVVAGRNHR